MAGKISMGTRRELIAAVAKRFQAAGRREKGRITSTTTLKHAVLIAEGEHGG